MPTLEALATATPEHRVPQSKIKAIGRSYLEEVAPEHLDMVSVFDHTGIKERQLACSFDWYLSGPGWSERAGRFEQVGTDLAASVSENVLQAAGLVPEAIDGVVFVQTTGIATPSLETHLANRIDLPNEVLRVPVWGLGCAGGVAGLSRAADLAKAHPDKRFLLVSLELCSLAFLREDLSKKMIVAAALFGDGAAGALVTGDELDSQGPRIQASASHLWPKTEDVMGWSVEEQGLGVVFSPRIPEIVEENFADIVAPFLKQNQARLEDVRTVFHPGGPKVLDAYEDSLDLPPDALEASREVLRAHGNMSSPTVLFTLEESLARASLAPGESALLAAVGPGFAAELALLEGV